MLTRLRFKHDFKFIVRCLSEKPPENEGKISQKQEKEDSNSKKPEKLDSHTEKIQALLKSMMAEPKITDSEYRERFTTAPERPRKAKSDEIEVKTEKIEETITKAAGEVAQAIGGNIKQTEAELLSKVLGKINQTSTSLSNLIVGMKIDRSKEKDELQLRETRGQQVRRLVDKSKVEIQTRFRERKQQAALTAQLKKSLPQPSAVNVFSGQPLGIFKGKNTNCGTELDVWSKLEQRELMLATLQPPANYFQKMALWTDQGKVWKFPINNEQGIEEENNIHFSEHIFLETHLEGWCPARGPIRHFMELVCTGLSKNAFYTAKEKKDHIMWYKEYFESKKDLLSEVGAWDVEPSNTGKTAST